MLLVPDALFTGRVSQDRHFNISEKWKGASTHSVPAVEMCSLISEAGTMISALLTL
jgi:hypothetical protein